MCDAACGRFFHWCAATDSVSFVVICFAATPMPPQASRNMGGSRDTPPCTRLDTIINTSTNQIFSFCCLSWHVH